MPLSRSLKSLVQGAAGAATATPSGQPVTYSANTTPAPIAKQVGRRVAGPMKPPQARSRVGLGGGQVRINPIEYAGGAPNEFAQPEAPIASPYSTQIGNPKKRPGARIMIK